MNLPSVEDAPGRVVDSSLDPLLSEVTVPDVFDGNGVGSVVGSHGEVRHARSEADCGSEFVESTLSSWTTKSEEVERYRRNSHDEGDDPHELVGGNIDVGDRLSIHNRPTEETREVSFFPQESIRRHLPRPSTVRLVRSGRVLTPW